MSHPVDIYVGKKIKFRRSMLGLSQEQLGNKIGVTFQQIQKYEKGLNRISSSKLYDFADILKVSVNHFFEGFSPEAEGMADIAKKGPKQDPSEQEINSLALDNKEVLSLIKAFYKIKSPDVRSRVLDLVKVISNDARMAEGFGDAKSSKAKKSLNKAEENI